MVRCHTSRSNSQSVQQGMVHTVLEALFDWADMMGLKDIEAIDTSLSQTLQAICRSMASLVFSVLTIM